MRKNVLMIIAIVCATSMMVSCKKDYQKLSTEFIRNLPDSCELLVQVENEAEHLVYYIGQGTDVFFCYNAETEKTKNIVIPDVESYDAPITIIGAGKENIMICHNEKAGDSDDSDLSSAYVQLYNLKTQEFKKFTICNEYEFDEGTKQISCISYDVDRYGDGRRTTDIYDFDGNLLAKKESEVCNFNEVPTGTLAAKYHVDNQDANETTYSTTNENVERPQTPHYYCMFCGAEFKTIRDLTSNTCQRRGFGEKHVLYEGGEKEKYTCRFCGAQFRTIRDLTSNSCIRRGVGEKHIPAV